MNIGQAAKESGVNAKMIRYYESIGLIGAVERSAAGYRSYAPADIQTLRFVRRARDFGFSINQIAELLKLWGDGSRASADVKSVALAHIAELEGKIADMQAMVSSLRNLASHCSGDERPECPIIDDLAEAGGGAGRPNSQRRASASKGGSATRPATTSA